MIQRTCLSEGLIRDALEQVWPPLQKNKPVLLHGDFWPGNIMWTEDQIIAVIDREDAGYGDPLGTYTLHYGLRVGCRDLDSMEIP